ncbi:Hypothetical protein CAP_6486 [Chondromyces apiculatus DSM 436]|uniref:Uncharacterized protein n=1 Tax=Chondromyces apiculatus DSM 436 TaxID=1192034 RepID=A0A017T2H2_9BACT|nr:Hypothetical protein CAP_6486 [Chondromyces apiculatus DSM 436]
MRLFQSILELTATHYQGADDMIIKKVTTVTVSTVKYP